MKTTRYVTPLREGGSLPGLVEADDDGLYVDPLFPQELSDRLDEFFADATPSTMPEAGHFSPLEAPEAFATAIRESLAGP